MKKSLIALCIVLLQWSSSVGQCVISCSNYAVASITPSLWPTAGNNAIPMFIPNTDDGYTPPVSIGFNFNFYCTTYSTVLIYTNGLIQFDIGAPSTFPFGYDAAQLIPNPSLPTVLNGMVCFRMDDLDPTVGGTVTYTTVGTSPNRAFVVTYSNVPQFGNGAILYSGQIILHETTNEIDIYSIAAPQGPNLATQGIEDATGTLGLAVSGRNQSFWSATNDAYRFSPAYMPNPPTAISGTISSCQGIANSYSVTPTPGATSYSWGLPAGWSGSSSTTVISATAGLSGSLQVTATYSCGTSSPAYYSVTVIPSPVVAFTSVTPAIFCSGPSVTITTSGALTYTVLPGPMIGTPPFTDTPLTNTTYTVVGTNTAGCVSKNLATYAVTVKETPTVTVNSGSICSGGEFTMTPSGASTYTFSSTFSVVKPAVGTHTFSVAGTSTNGCVSNTAISSVTVAALPIILASSTRTSICLKEVTTLTASGGLSYTWSAGTNSTSVTLSVSPVTQTTYSVTGIDGNGCENTGTISVKVNVCNALTEIDPNNTLEIYPNPSSGIFNIKANESVTFQILDMTGKLVYQGEVLEGAHQMDLSRLSPGKYFIVTVTRERQDHRLIMIE
jgi:hypothetical protein